MELYPAKFDWTDNDWLLVQDVAVRNIVNRLPHDLCEVYIGHNLCAPVTVIVTIIERHIAPLKRKLQKGHFGKQLSPTVQAMIEYAEKHPDPNGEYCFVFVEP